MDFRTLIPNTDTARAMSPERPEESYQPVLRLDYDIKAPGFFSYVR